MSFLVWTLKYPTGWSNWGTEPAPYSLQRGSCWLYLLWANQSGSHLQSQGHILMPLLLWISNLSLVFLFFTSSSQARWHMMAKGNGAFYLFAWKHECIMHNQCFFPWDRKPGNSPLYHLTKSLDYCLWFEVWAYSHQIDMMNACSC